LNTAVIGATTGAVFGLIGVLVGQYLTQLRLTQTQIDEAVGNDATKLPDHLQRPPHWRRSRRKS
jgi:hypothetical protein